MMFPPFLLPNPDQIRSVELWMGRGAAILGQKGQRGDWDYPSNLPT